jgi:hypothetical protein
VNRGTNSECTPDDGWCLPGTLTAIRERINAILREIASKPQANQGAFSSASLAWVLAIYYVDTVCLSRSWFF